MVPAQIKKKQLVREVIVFEELSLDAKFSYYKWVNMSALHGYVVMMVMNTRKRQRGGRTGRVSDNSTLLMNSSCDFSTSDKASQHFSRKWSGFIHPQHLLRSWLLEEGESVSFNGVTTSRWTMLHICGYMSNKN